MWVHLWLVVVTGSAVLATNMTEDECQMIHQVHAIRSAIISMLVHHSNVTTSNQNNNLSALNPLIEAFNFTDNEALFTYISCHLKYSERIQNKTDLTWDDLSREDQLLLLEVEIGLATMDIEWAVPLTVYYVILFMVGIIGNLLTCLIICTNAYMRTPSNFFLVSLAVTDMMSLICGERKKTKDFSELCQKKSG